jgi:hypothetical protein
MRPIPHNRGRIWIDRERGRCIRSAQATFSFNHETSDGARLRETNLCYP